MVRWATKPRKGCVKDIPPLFCRLGTPFSVVSVDPNGCTPP